MDADGRTGSPNECQIEYWNGPSGRVWATHREAYDTQLRRHLGLVIDAADPRPGESAVDVGCGTGALTCEVGRRVGPTGRVTGLDVAAPLVQLARRRAADADLDGVTFLEADAATATITPVDLLVSRFGVMFFADPSAAFTNLRARLRPGGRLAFVCWQPRERNLWAELPGVAVRDLVDVPTVAAGEPGPFSFADPEATRCVLSSAGWTDVTVEPDEGELTIGGTGTLEELATFIVEAGILRSLFAGADARLRAAAVEHVAAAVAPFHDGERLRFPDAVWVVTART